jgi:hypothetical protein
MAKPDWFVLMHEWVTQNHGDRGITLPFLVGALAYKENSTPTESYVRGVLNEMIANPVDDYVTEIGWCASLGSPVLAATQGPSRFSQRSAFGIHRRTGYASCLAKTCNCVGTVRTRRP